MDKAFLKELLDLGGNVAKSILPGATEAIEAGKSAVKLIQRAKEMFDDEDQPDIEKTLNELVDAVNKHADETIGKSRGD